MRMKPYQAWPAWRYGPNGQAQIFQREEDVPVGWVDSPGYKWPEEDEKPPQDGKDAWGGYPKEHLIQMLRKAGERVVAHTSARKLYERAKALGLIAGEGEESDGGSDA